ncbi:hypothetical protein [Rhizosphaericola mali]|uniref:Uncharacterized protein n=1 Tax=Rhizosphaericola mali TaxID=2545455 RepID=A0A5P2FVQ3_9BACT|nr:hypothetical protein [Rhizosphaericola mali]QES87584.1 hypothetical protein E0W69_002510 [Rhizosphaericola mali]
MKFEEKIVDEEKLTRFLFKETVSKDSKTGIPKVKKNKVYVDTRNETSLQRNKYTDNTRCMFLANRILDIKKNMAPPQTDIHYGFAIFKCSDFYHVKNDLLKTLRKSESEVKLSKDDFCNESSQPDSNISIFLEASPSDLNDKPISNDDASADINNPDYQVGHAHIRFYNPIPPNNYPRPEARLFSEKLCEKSSIEFL